MWAYKLDKAVNQPDMTLRVSRMREKLVAQQRAAQHEYNVRCLRMDQYDWSDELSKPDPPSDDVAKFDQDLSLAKNMARSLGWDRTTHGEPQCWLVPGPSSYMYGFIITQATSGERFVISPVPLEYLKDRLSYDAYTSLEEVQRMTSALDGDSLPPLKWNGEWKRSRNGNQYCFINGAQVTIFASKRAPGFCGVIASQSTDLKVFTHTFSTEQECAVYVVKYFYQLVKDWSDDSEVIGAGKLASADNPFEGVDWGDD